MYTGSASPTTTPAKTIIGGARCARPTLRFPLLPPSREAAMFGPVLSRELAIAPRRVRISVGQAYVGALLLLSSTAWLVLTGTQIVRDVGDLARFGAMLFQILAGLQAALAMFFSALLAAGAVAQEKDRRTLVLLLLTHLSNGELVLGKLAASLLNVVVMLAAALPLFVITALLGGVSFAQIARVFAVTLASVAACGSLGSTVALWREKTFQALAMTVLALVLWLAVGEIIAAGSAGREPGRRRLRRLGSFGQPLAGRPPGDESLRRAAAGLGLLSNAGLPVSCRRRGLDAVVEQPGGGDGPPLESFPQRLLPAEVNLSWTPLPASKPDNTLAAFALPSLPPAPGMSGTIPFSGGRFAPGPMGEKSLIIRLVYWLLFGLAVVSLLPTAGGATAAAAQGVVALLLLLLLSLVLVNAQAVTSMTSERDARALDLLLVTDLTPKEIVFGKLGGIFYNTKEMVLLPMLLGGCLGWGGRSREPSLLARREWRCSICSSPCWASTPA